MSFSDDVEKEQIKAEFDRCFNALMKSESRVKELEAYVDPVTEQAVTLKEENSRLRIVVEQCRAKFDLLNMKDDQAYCREALRELDGESCESCKGCPDCKGITWNGPGD